MWIPPSRTRLVRQNDWLVFGGCMDLPKGHPALGVKTETLELEEA